jgi:hypothetical protein
MQYIKYILYSSVCVLCAETDEYTELKRIRCQVLNGVTSCRKGRRKYYTVYILRCVVYYLRHVCVRYSASPYGTTQFPLHGFHDISYVKFFRKPVKKIQVSIISDNNNGSFT